ncbi:MAG TPA: RNA polymerase sigma factor [Streptomyces sp.]|nr:RNA polymerase sigma factor [Streptomyces sp.]
MHDRASHSTRRTAPDPRRDQRFDEVFGALLPRLYRRSVQLTGRASHTAEDAVHDTYLKLAARPGPFLDHPEPYAYALRTLLSVIRDGLRRERRTVPVADAGHRTAGGTDGRGGAWDGGLERHAAETEVRRLLATLTPRQAGAVTLVDLHGHTLDQAARILGVHRGTVARTRERALDHLRRRLTG